MGQTKSVFYKYFLRGLTYLFILVGCDRYEFSLFEDVGAESRVGQFEDVIGTYEMKPWLILMHRVQNCLE